MGPEKITRLIQAYLEELVEDKTEVGRGGSGNQEKQDKWGEAELCRVFDNSPNTAGLWTYFKYINTAQIMVLLVMEMCDLLVCFRVNTQRQTDGRQFLMNKSAPSNSQALSLGPFLLTPFSSYFLLSFVHSSP